ncbi:MAG: hypothetical protein NVSMB57_09640 [Actinomycetota bacterium]
MSKVDGVAGSRGRSQFIREAVAFALANHERWTLFESSVGSISERGHEWDADPAAWLRAQRHSDKRRIG